MYICVCMYMYVCIITYYIYIYFFNVTDVIVFLICSRELLVDCDDCSNDQIIGKKRYYYE